MSKEGTDDLPYRPAPLHFEPLLDAHDGVAIEKAELPLGENQAMLLKNVLSPSECKHYVRVIEDLGGSAVNWRQDDRSNSRLVADSTSLADMLWLRCAEFFSDIVVEMDVADESQLEPFSPGGKWKPSGLNERFKACLYTKGEQFGPHHDAHFVRSGRERSWRTFMVYLNDDFDGGATNFLTDNTATELSNGGSRSAARADQGCIKVEPEQGLAVVFNPQILHEAAVVSKGFKYVLTTEVIYKREGGKEMEPHDAEALLLFQNAQDAEAEGEVGKAASLYRRAFKMSPRLGRAYGQGR